MAETSREKNRFERHNMVRDVFLYIFISHYYPVSVHNYSFSGQSNVYFYLFLSLFQHREEKTATFR